MPSRFPPIARRRSYRFRKLFFLFELRFEFRARFGEFHGRLRYVYAVQNVLQTVLGVEIFDGLVSDHRRERSVGEPLHGGIHDGGDRRAENGNALDRRAHRLYDGLPDVQTAEPVGDERVLEHARENLREARVGRAEPVEEYEVLHELEIDERDEKGIHLCRLRNGGIGRRAERTLEDEVLRGLFHGAVIELGERRFELLFVPRVEGDGKPADRLRVVPRHAVHLCGEVDDLVRDLAAELSIVLLRFARRRRVYVGHEKSRAHDLDEGYDIEADVEDEADARRRIACNFVEVVDLFRDEEEADEYDDADEGRAEAHGEFRAARVLPLYVFLLVIVYREFSAFRGCGKPVFLFCHVLLLCEAIQEYTTSGIL